MYTVPWYLSDTTMCRAIVKTTTSIDPMAADAHVFNFFVVGVRRNNAPTKKKNQGTTFVLVIPERTVPKTTHDTINLLGDQCGLHENSR
jgi:hypothetical protein